MKEHEIYYDFTVAFRGLFQRWPGLEECKQLAAHAKELYEEGTTKKDVGGKILARLELMKKASA